MSVRVGAGIGQDAVRVVVVRGREILWSAEVEREPDQSLGSALEAVFRATLESDLRTRWARTPVQVALGPHSSQVKLLEGLPETEDSKLLAQVIWEARRSLFLADEGPLTTGSVRLAGTGAAWAAAFDESDVTEVRDVFRALGLRRGVLMPTGIVLHRSAANQRFAWPDGELGLDVSCGSAGLEALRRQPLAGISPEVPPLEPVPELTALGEGAASFADAYGAAILDDEEWVALGVAAAHPPPRSAGWRRLVYPTLVGAVALALAGLSPLYTSILAERAETALGEFHAGERWLAVGPVFDQLGDITAALTEIETFAHSRTGMAILLAELSRELPEGTVLVRFEIDGPSGEVVALAPDASELLEGLRRWRRLDSVEIGSPVTRTTAGGRRVERVMLAFRLPEGPDPERRSQ